MLDEPVGEVVLMLEQNIWAKFKLTPAMRYRQQRRRLAVGG